MPDLEKLNDKLEKAQEDHEAAHEVVVGAIRGLLETAQYGDSESVALLVGIQRSMAQPGGDDALDEALRLFFDTLKAYNAVSAEVRAAISRQDG